VAAVVEDRHEQARHGKASCVSLPRMVSQTIGTGLQRSIARAPQHARAVRSRRGSARTYVAPLGMEELGKGAALRDGVAFEPGMSFRDTNEKSNELFERRYLTWLITCACAEGNISKAARDADMDRNTSPSCCGSTASPSKVPGEDHN